MALAGPWKHIVKVTTDGEVVRLFHIDCPSPQPEEKGFIIPIHRFLETIYQCRQVLKPLSEAGYHLVRSYQISLPTVTLHILLTATPKHCLPTICNISFKTIFTSRSQSMSSDMILEA
jgi:hypothetical protein